MEGYQLPKIDAILACRNQGSRLYGKPLQNLGVGGPTIIESLIQYINSIESVNSVILAISEEPENNGFVKLAEKLGLRYTFGDQHDVLGRIIKAADEFQTDIVFRSTSENPFMLAEFGEELISEFVEGDFDWGALMETPDGTGIELIKLSALKASHANGQMRHKSELVTSYIFDHQSQFKILRKKLPLEFRRPDIRLTVDYAEDLIFCQNVWRSLKRENELISVRKIIEFWDDNPDLREPVEAIGVDWGHGRLWE